MALEARFLETEKYVEFDLAHNGKVYSMEYMMLLQAVCSEIDVVGKVYAGLCDKNFKATKYTGLNEWWYYITKDNSSLTNETVAFRHAENLQPWKNYRVVENKACGWKVNYLKSTYDFIQIIFRRYMVDYRCRMRVAMR